MLLAGNSLQIVWYSSVWQVELILLVLCFCRRNQQEKILDQSNISYCWLYSPLTTHSIRSVNGAAGGHSSLCGGSAQVHNSTIKEKETSLHLCRKLAHCEAWPSTLGRAALRASAQGPSPLQLGRVQTKLKVVEAERRLSKTAETEIRTQSQPLFAAGQNIYIKEALNVIPTRNYTGKPSQGHPTTTELAAQQIDSYHLQESILGAPWLWASPRTEQLRWPLHVETSMRHPKANAGEEVITDTLFSLLSLNTQSSR